MVVVRWEEQTWVWMNRDINADDGMISVGVSEGKHPHIHLHHPPSVLKPPRHNGIFFPPKRQPWPAVTLRRMKGALEGCAEADIVKLDTKYALAERRRRVKWERN